MQRPCTGVSTARAAHLHVTAGHNPGTDVLRVMARDAEGKVGKFTAQNMSNTLLAYAKLQHHPGHLMEVMAAEALCKLESFTPQVLTPALCLAPLSSLRPLTLQVQ